MERFDIIIVGGGPAGATAAETLATEGARVLLLDSASFPRVKLCAGWVTAQVWESLAIPGKDYPGTLQPFSRARLELDGQVLETRWAHTASYGIIRSEFDHYLLQRASTAGASIRTNTRVQTLRRAEESWIISIGDTQASAPVVVGAGGHSCPVARQLGAIDKNEAVVMARESETRLDEATLARVPAKAGIPELILEDDLNGYGWVFRKGPFLNIGLGCIDAGRALNQRCTTLLERLRAEERLPADIELEPFRGHAYAVRLRGPRRPSGKDWLLVGDAAGLARAFSGEGIGPAIISGRIAASMILAGTIEQYPSHLDQNFGAGEPGRIGNIIGHLPRPFLDRIGRTICQQPLLRRKMVFEGAFGMG